MTFMHFQVFNDILLGDDNIIGLVRERSLYAAFMYHHPLTNHPFSNSARKTFAQHYITAWNHGTNEQTLHPPSKSGDEAGVGIGPLDNNSPLENEDKICTAKINEKRNIIKGAMLKGFSKSLSCNIFNVKLMCFASGPRLPSPPQGWFKSCYASLDESSQDLE
jgi:hypothetical protein